MVRVEPNATALADAVEGIARRQPSLVTELVKREGLEPKPEQVRRVIINLVDNAVEATERNGLIVVETEHDASNSLVRITVAGPCAVAACAAARSLQHEEAEIIGRLSRGERVEHVGGVEVP